MVVRKRSGKWVVDYYLSGKRKIPSFSTKAEAQAFKRELLLRKVDMQTGYRAIKCVKLKEAIKKYYSLVSILKSERTKDNERYYFEVLFQYFGDINLNELNLLSLEEFQFSLKNRLSNSTVNRYFNCYKNFFSKCVDWEYLLVSPSSKLKSLPEELKPKKVWKDSEIQKIVEVDSWVSDIVYTLAVTGARAGEVCKLKWHDIDFESNLINLSSKKGTGRIRVRQVPMSNELVKLLRQRELLARRMFKARPDDSVFLNASGLPANSGHLSREVRRLSKQMGFKELTLHGLRHTFISRLAGMNHSLEKIRLLVGHENLKTTQGYLHINQDELRETVHALESSRKLFFRN